MKSTRDMTPQEKTAKKKRQRHRQVQRYRRIEGSAGALAAAVESAWDDAPGDVKAAVAKYREAVKRV